MVGCGNKDEAKPARLEPDHPRLREFRDFLADDLNVPRAVSVVWNVLREDMAGTDKLALLYAFDRVLGLGLEALESDREEVPENVVELARQRTEARNAKNWPEADRLRDLILAEGYSVKDTSEGPIVSKT